MRVKVTRDVCDSQLAFCERCLGKFLREPLGYERHCFDEIIDDGQEDLTIEINSGGQQAVVVLNEEQRKIAAIEGWTFFVDIDTPMYREEGKAERRSE